MIELDRTLLPGTHYLQRDVLVHLGMPEKLLRTPPMMSTRADTKFATKRHEITKRMHELRQERTRLWTKLDVRYMIILSSYGSIEQNICVQRRAVHGVHCIVTA